jgi:hypothetical protein
MAVKILQSFHPYEMRVMERKVGDKILPMVTLPKARYRPQEVYLAGPRKGFTARSIIELTDEEQESILESAQIRGMIDRGVYKWLDSVPESLRTTEDVVAELRAENEELKAKLAMVPVPAAISIELVEAVGQAVKQTAELGSMAYTDLVKMAGDLGLSKGKGTSRVKLIEAIEERVGINRGPVDPEINS